MPHVNPTESFEHIPQSIVLSRDRHLNCCLELGDYASEAKHAILLPPMESNKQVSSGPFLQVKSL